MWREARLAFTDAVAGLNCSVVPAHPWVYGLGHQTESGSYLSPVNAVEYLAGKLATQNGRAEVMIMMVASQSHEAFMTSLGEITDVFPSAAFSQVKRLAQSVAQLASEKMQIPSAFSAGLPACVPLSVPTSRAAFAAAAVKEAKEAAAAALDMTGLKSQLASFTALRDSLTEEIESGLGELQGKSARVWVFTASGDVAGTLLTLVRDIPEPSAIYTAAMMLVGDNLDGVKGMIHELDPDTGA